MVPIGKTGMCCAFGFGAIQYHTMYIKCKYIIVLCCVVSYTTHHEWFTLTQCNAFTC